MWNTEIIEVVKRKYWKFYACMPIFKWFPDESRNDSVFKLWNFKCILLNTMFWYLTRFFKLKRKSSDPPNAENSSGIQQKRFWIVEKMVPGKSGF